MIMRKIPFVISLVVLGLMSGLSFANKEWLNLSLMVVVLLMLLTVKEDKR